MVGLFPFPNTFRGPPKQGSPLHFGVPAGVRGRGADLLYLHNSASGPEFWPDCHRKNSEIGPPAGRTADFVFFPGSSPAKIRPGRPISGPEALLRNIES